jgi:outer membrane protein assembly factor BamE (lipoprotein component of BamABCDE complex)
MQGKKHLKALKPSQWQWRRRMRIRQKGGRNEARTLAKIGLVAALSVALCGCLNYDGDIQRGYVADDKLLDQVKEGSSAEQVLVVLGTPSTTSTIGGDAWYYISQKTHRSLAFVPPKIVDQRVVAVYFDKNKKVERLANYGLDDGKVFDFISRTTPTGGAEQSFVRNMFKSFLQFY